MRSAHAARPFARRIVSSMRRAGPPMFLADMAARPCGQMRERAPVAQRAAWLCQAGFATWLGDILCVACRLSRCAVAFHAPMPRVAIGCQLCASCCRPRAVLAATWQMRELRSHVLSDLVDEAKWILKSVTA
jgi:hypothetical protein